MRDTRIIGLVGVLALAALVSAQHLCSGEPSNASSESNLAGIFDPYEFQDRNITDKAVFKPRPECGECHARATVSQAQDGTWSLGFLVDRGTRTNTWTLVGKKTDKGILFTDGKLQLTYAGDKLEGKFEGRMRARVSLKPKE